MITQKELEEVLVQVNGILKRYDERITALENKPAQASRTKK
jgi:hypothetical protein